MVNGPKIFLPLRKKIKVFLLLTVILVLAIIIFNLMNKRPTFHMITNNHITMKNEIEKYIPIGSKLSYAKYVMDVNKFTYDGLKNNYATFYKDNGRFPFYEGNRWDVTMRVKDERVVDIQVWIAPSQARKVY